MCRGNAFAPSLQLAQVVMRHLGLHAAKIGRRQDDVV